MLMVYPGATKVRETKVDVGGARRWCDGEEWGVENLNK